MEFQRLSSAVKNDVFKFQEFSCNFILKTPFFFLLLFCILNRFNNKMAQVGTSLVLPICNFSLTTTLHLVMLLVFILVNIVSCSAIFMAVFFAIYIYSNACKFSIKSTVVIPKPHSGVVGTILICKLQDI